MALKYTLIQAVYILKSDNTELLRILQNKPYKFPVKDLCHNFDTLAIPALAMAVNTCSQISTP